MWNPPVHWQGCPDDSHELSVCSRPTSLATIEGHDYTPNTPDFPERTSRIPLLHKEFSHEQTFPSMFTAGRDAQYQYPSPDEPSHENRSQTRRASTRRHPFASQFEAPDWQQLLIHSVLCLLAYPLLLLVVLIASSRPLFWTRTIVGLGCGLIGSTLGLSLLPSGQKFLEAAAWATVIHRSHVPDAPGIKLKDLAASSSDPTSAFPALRLLCDRWMYPGTARKSREHYDRRPWSLVILFFLLVVFATAASPFALGRLVNIDTRAEYQREEYSEVIVKGDLSDADIARATALKPTFDDFTLTWTLAPFSDHGGLPPVASFRWNNDTVYFAETILPQLQSNGTGLGTFETDSNMMTAQGQVPLSEPSNARDLSQAIDPGAILRFPRWGTRLHCAKIPDGDKNLVIRSPNNFTYLFTPHNVIRPLFASFDMEYKGVPPFNTSQVLKLNDTLPPGLNVADTAIGGAFYDNGVAHSFLSSPISMGQEGTGFITVEHVLVRLNTSYAPSGKFLRTTDISVPDKYGNPSFIGYDAAVCLQLFEPWILETYNSSIGLPSSVRLVEPGNVVRDMNTQKLREKRKGPPLTDPNVSRQLNSSKLLDVYVATHQNTINQIIKDNGRDAFYVPSPTIISFTSGSGALGYTELSETFFAQARGLADASNSLPYLVGSRDTLARLYLDSVLSKASFKPVYVSLYLLGMWTLGLLGGLFVPKLPLNVPHRGFELYSWMAAFHADELVGNETEMRMTRNMELHEISDRLGELKFRYQG